MICVLYTHARIVRMYVYVGTLGGHFRIEEFQLAFVFTNSNARTPYSIRNV